LFSSVLQEVLAMMRAAIIGLLLFGWLFLSVAVCAEQAGRAEQILDGSGFQGGLVLHLGCGDGRMTAELARGEGVLVHGLDTRADNVQQARAHIRSLDRAGRITADVFDGKHLPLIDDMVNLVVAETLGDVPLAEVLRVLAPQGIAYVLRDGQWTKTVKPWPDDIDQWTHYLYDASNNAVSQDRRVGPLKHLQWQCGPRWSRHHDHMASVSAMVSARGRMFCILDEGSPVSPQFPADWQLVARDGFNGVLLWKRPIAQWHDALWPLKSGPADLPRRLVADGDVVYATLGITAPVSALDAATGQTLREYADTAGAEEIVVRDGRLLVLVNRTPVDYDADLATDPEQGQSRDSRTTYSPAMGRLWAGIRSQRWSHADRVLRALDAGSGRLLWEKAGRVIPLTLAADADNAYYHDGEKIVALELATGRPRWSSDPVPVWQGLEGRGLQSWFAPTLVATAGKVLFAGGEKTHMSYMGWGSQDIGQDTMTAFSAETGEKLWTADHPYAGYNSPEDLLIAQGRVWVGSTAKGGPQGYYAGHDLRTGRAEVSYPPTLDTYWFHHRCYRAKATEQYVLCSRTGIEFVDLKTGQWTIHHWVRGGCLYGIMPANGLIYAPPHPCACYPESKLYGFVALAAGSPTRAVPDALPPEKRSERGPAFEEMKEKANAPDSHEFGGAEGEGDDAWPTFRADPARSGYTAARLPARLMPAWETMLGGRLTAPVAADGKLLVASIDTHTIHALDAASGQPVWSYAAGGRIDSPPTVWQGRVLFGSADGSVYCLRASDGALVWRFRAAPVDRRMVAFEQLESVWPLHGSVLVQDGIVTAVAGRSMFLDGGLRLVRLDAATGQLLGEKVLDDQDPVTGDALQSRVKGLNMPVALPDILASDGQRLMMRSQVMDLEGNRLGLGPSGSTSDGSSDRLLVAYGFTDDTWFHRIYWLFGDSFQGGVGGFAGGTRKPAGRILVNNDTTVFGYGRKPEYFRWGSAIDYHLFAAVRPGGPSGEPAAVFFDKAASLDPARSPLTIAAWVKTDAPDGTVLVRGAQQNGFALIISGRKPRMIVRTGGKTYDAAAEKAIGSAWTHIAGVLDAEGRMAVYVDGQPDGRAENVPLLSSNPSIGMKVGYDDTNQLLPEPLTPFHGALDEVLLYHRALEPEQIRSLAAGQDQFSREDRQGQMLHLTFADGQARDSSPGGNHGTLQNAKRIEGRVGDGLLLEQPQLSVAAEPGRRRAPVPLVWSRDVPVMVRAMALAGDTLMCAGPAELVDEVAAFQNVRDPAVQQQLAAQDAAIRGQSGGILLTVDAKTGETLGEYPLGSPPVFDGLIVAAGRVLIATMDGRLIAWDGQPEEAR
jgi:outer membrane protein assembly factor BamB